MKKGHFDIVDIMDIIPVRWQIEEKANLYLTNFLFKNGYLM